MTTARFVAAVQITSDVVLSVAFLLVILTGRVSLVAFGLTVGIALLTGYIGGIIDAQTDRRAVRAVTWTREKAATVRAAFARPDADDAS